MLNCIAAYHDEHGDYSYLIMNEKMMKKLPKKHGVINVSENGGISSYTSGSIILKNQYPQTIAVDGKEYIPANDKNDLIKWQNCKIMIDDDLEFGEIYIK